MHVFLAVFIIAMAALTLLAIPSRFILLGRKREPITTSDAIWGGALSAIFVALYILTAIALLGGFN